MATDTTETKKVAKQSTEKPSKEAAALAELRRIAAYIAGDGDTAKTRDCAAFFVDTIDRVLKGQKPDYARFNINTKSKK